MRHEPVRLGWRIDDVERADTVGSITWSERAILTGLIFLGGCWCQPPLKIISKDGLEGDPPLKILFTGPDHPLTCS